MKSREAVRPRLLSLRSQGWPRAATPGPSLPSVTRENSDPHHQPRKRPNFKVPSEVPDGCTSNHRKSGTTNTFLTTAPTTPTAEDPPHLKLCVAHCKQSMRLWTNWSGCRWPAPELCDLMLLTSRWLGWGCETIFTSWATMTTFRQDWTYSAVLEKMTRIWITRNSPFPTFFRKISNLQKPE